jgi:hypothetical protein
MRNLLLTMTLLLLLLTNPATAQSTRHIMIPSSSFTPQQSDDGYSGNQSGTNRHLGATGFLMFAPVNLPHGATVTEFRCGAGANTPDFRMRFTLRGNQAQVLNVDLAEVATSFGGTGFEVRVTTSINEPVIDNLTFNYYIVATVDDLVGGSCGFDCRIGFCRITYE